MNKQTTLIIVFLFLLGACSPNAPEAQVLTQTATPPPTATFPNTPTPTTQPTESPPTPTPDPRKVNYTTSGMISEDEVWRGEIHLTGDITFENDAVLTIEPGTTVFFTPNSDDQHSGWAVEDDYILGHNDPVGTLEWAENTIIIDGRHGIINAVGTAEEPLTFKPEGDSTSSAQWGGIHFERGKLMHAVVLYGGRTAVQISGEYGQVEIAYNEVRYFHWAGIDSHAENVWIHHNIVEGGGHQAIGFAPGNLIEYNVVYRSQNCVNGYGNEVIIRNNILVDCGRGISSVTGTNTWFYNNTILWIDGPPDGFYYQGELIYPIWDLTYGIGYNGDGLIHILDNIIAAPYDWGIGYGEQVDPQSEVAYNLGWQTNILPDWMSSPPENNFEGDPLFVSLEDFDLHLQNGSPAIGTGFPGWASSDTSLDLGAYGGPEAGGWENPVERVLDYRDVIANVSCNCQVEITQGDYLTLAFGWYVKEYDQAVGISDAAHIELSVEGFALENTGDWGPDPLGPRPNAEFPYLRPWRLLVLTEDIPPGTYRITAKLVFTGYHTDGADEFNPGDSFEWYVDIVVNPN